MRFCEMFIESIHIQWPSCKDHRRAKFHQTLYKARETVEDRQGWRAGWRAAAAAAVAEKKKGWDLQRLVCCVWVCSVVMLLWNTWPQCKIQAQPITSCFRIRLHILNVTCHHAYMSLWLASLVVCLYMSFCTCLMSVNVQYRSYIIYVELHSFVRSEHSLCDCLVYCLVALSSLTLLDLRVSYV